MVPWLLVLEILSRSNQPFSSLVQERMAAFPASGEINREVADAQAAIDKVQEHYTSQAQETDFTDGLSMDMGEWRFNLRKSNTEPVIRLNVESRADPALMQCKTDEILNLLAD